MGNIARQFLMPVLLITIVGTLYAVAWQREMTDEAQHAGQLCHTPIDQQELRAAQGIGSP